MHTGNPISYLSGINNCYILNFQQNLKQLYKSMTWEIYKVKICILFFGYKFQDMLERHLINCWYSQVRVHGPIYTS